MRIITLVFFLVISIVLSAQQKVSEQVIGWRGSSIQLNSISDKQKQRVATVVLNNDSLKVYVLQGPMQLKQSVTIARKAEEKFLGGFFKDDKVVLFLDNGQDPGVHSWVVDLTQNEGLEHVIPFDIKKEKIIDRISCGDHFLYFTINKKTSEFAIYDFMSEENYTTSRYTFTENLWHELTDGDAFSRSLSVEKVDFEGDCNVDVAASHNKIYVQNDTLYLVTNKIKGQTKIFSFSLADQKVSVKSILHGVRTTDYLGQQILVDNSFLLKDKLYYVYASSDSLGIQVLDFYNGKVLKNYFVEKDDDLPFKNTPIIQEGGGTVYSGSGPRELGKTKQLLRKVANAEAFISATMNHDGQVEVSVGSYKKMSAGAGAGGMWMPTGASVTGMTYMPTGGFYRSNWTKSAHFKMLLNPANCEHIKGDVQPSINEQIEAYTQDIKIPSEAENLFMCDGQYHYAYYDKKERKLCIVKFL